MLARKKTVIQKELFNPLNKSRYYFRSYSKDFLMIEYFADIRIFS